MAARRESIASRGYDRREMAGIRSEVRKHKKEWIKRFDGFLENIAGMDMETPPAELAKRAADLTDERAKLLAARFAGIDEG